MTRLDRLIQRRALRRWSAAERRLDQMEPATLLAWREAARSLQAPLDRFARRADIRLGQPGSGDPAAPEDADWTWRPEPWCAPLDPCGWAPAVAGTQVGAEVTLFHDCSHPEVTLRQIPARCHEPAAPFALHLDALDFTGSYLSLAIDLPPDAAAGIGRMHLVGLDLDLEVERPTEIYARLNLQHGPNAEQMTRSVPLTGDRARVEFDLAATKLNDKRVARLWLDVIVEAPRMNRVVLHDLTLFRRLRAAL